MNRRFYLRLHGCTSEDTSLPRMTSYQMMTAATGPYQRIRASMERAIWSIGLNQSHRTRRTRQSVPAWRAAQGSTECDCQRRSSAVACLRCAFRVISDKGAPVTCAGRGRTCTCAVPIVYLAWTCGLSRGSRVRRPLQEGTGQRPGRRFGAPQGEMAVNRVAGLRYRRSSLTSSGLAGKLAGGPGCGNAAGAGDRAGGAGCGREQASAPSGGDR